MNKSFDLLVIGFGKVGKTIAMTRAGIGEKMAPIERDPKIHGGTCITIACEPTKQLLYAAALPVRHPVTTTELGKGSTFTRPVPRCLTSCWSDWHRCISRQRWGNTSTHARRILAQQIKIERNEHFSS